MNDTDLSVTMPEVKVTFTHLRPINRPGWLPKPRRDRMPEDSDLEQYSRKRHPYPASTFGGKTIATLKEKETGQVLAQGCAFCSMGDCFEYKTGRKIALERAMQSYLRKQATVAWHQCPAAEWVAAGQNLKIPNYIKGSEFP
jgi:hypothetical protein